jgi:hypothetical protein
MILCLGDGYSLNTTPGLRHYRRLHLVRAGRGRRVAYRPVPRTAGHPPWLGRAVHQNLSHAVSPGGRSCRSHLAQAAGRADPASPAHPGRLGHARTHCRPSRRPLRTDQRTLWEVHDPHLQPGGPDEWYKLFPNPVVAESLLDRPINTSYRVFMDGPSYRPNKRASSPCSAGTGRWLRSPTPRSARHSPGRAVGAGRR